MVFVFDLDGTLLNNNYTISEKTINFIKSLEKCGHKLFFASGRMLISIKKVVEKFFEKEYPIIAYNGGMVYLPEEGIVFEKSLDFSSAKKVIEFLRSENVHRQIYVDDKLYGEEDNDEIKFYAKHASVDYYIVDDLVKLLRKKLPVKILSIVDKEKIKLLKDKLNSLNLEIDVFKSMDIFLDIVPKDINKGEALEFLIKKLDLKGEIVAFGDNYNDIPLFKVANISIAMGNASNDVKREADYIAPSNNEDGVYSALVELFSDCISC
ncbi:MULTISPECIES: Cof-type HAD-IIB family hydrolase [unclassified Thermosipho (in: thermotogales)]|uniref:Cof-type HAD-IIB family hydrolase n=1 Tax=unclassified Thermosipho (in: thermotogales) TaxID=2676525 RepID=UPI000986A083|nr:MULTISPECIES: Cof-type HAD-IIB family hydrolase [unclassified Thermosipho (in: thermotogales)]MBT1248128.1 hydrolase Cof [Thermosipho sp. 1244]OOC46535.1 hydrolase Cof [Thermosipho sp. 1223]